MSAPALAELGEETIYLAADGDLEALKRFVNESGVNPKVLVNWKDEWGKTPLHAASANGHLDCVKWLIEQKARLVPNESGSTALHWAIYRKETAVVRALFEAFPEVDVLAEPNKHTKSLLHMAYASGDTEIVGMVVSHPSAAPLDKMADEAERRAREEGLTIPDEDEEETPAEGTEGESKEGNADTAGLGLGGAGLDGAEEKKAGDAEVVDDGKLEELLAGALLDAADKEAKAVEEGKGGKVAEAEVIHEFAFTKKGAVIRVREVATPATVIGEDASADSTGCTIWAGAIVLSRWIVDLKDKFTGKTVCELGSGCGLAGLTALLYTNCTSVTFTDLNERALSNLRFNVAQNTYDSRDGKASSVVGTSAPRPLKERATVLSLDWTRPVPPSHRGQYDIIIGSDLVYTKKMVRPLLNTIKSLLKPGGTVFFVSAETDRDGLTDFIQGMTATGPSGVGLTQHTMKKASDKYRANPLLNSTQADCYLHFNELATKQFQLHEFSAKKR